MRSLRVFSRHPSHKGLRGVKLMLPVLTLIRLGSTTKGNLPYKVQLNSPESVKNSSSKLLMKHCFTKAGIKTSPWCPATYIDVKTINDKGFQTNCDDTGIEELTFPIITKSIFGSRGIGNTKINTNDELINWLKGKDLKQYIIESYKTFTREYRIHATELGAFYTCRKMLLKDTPKEKRFQRHDDNCKWFLEDNPGFDKPINWDVIVADCVKALKGLGMDIGAFDIKVQSAKDGNGKKRKDVDYIIIESCSAPSFGEKTLQKYIEVIPKLVNCKLGK